jgi:uncharacterized protein (DUF1015 family)
VYAKGAENLARLVDDGVLLREASPALYLYRQIMGDHVQTGLVAGASVDEYENDLIKKHEFTRPRKRTTERVTWTPWTRTPGRSS